MVKDKKSSKEPKVPIRVCMKCFSPLYDWLGKSTAEAGVIEMGGPLTGVYTCSRCGHEGLPLEFDSIKDYQAFLNVKGENPGMENALEKTDKRSIASKMVFGEFKLMLLIFGIALVLFVILLALKILFGS